MNIIAKADQSEAFFIYTRWSNARLVAIRWFIKVTGATVDSWDLEELSMVSTVAVKLTIIVTLRRTASSTPNILFLTSGNAIEENLYAVRLNNIWTDVETETIFYFQQQSTMENGAAPGVVLLDFANVILHCQNVSGIIIALKSGQFACRLHSDSCKIWLWFSEN